MTAQFLRELIDSEIFVGAGYDDANLVAALARFGGDHLAHRTVSDQCQSHSCLLNCVANLKYMSTASSSSRFEMRSWSVCASRIEPGPSNKAFPQFDRYVPYLSNWGKALLLGPGSILDAHTDHERISKRELEDAVDIYFKLATQLSKHE